MSTQGMWQISFEIPAAPAMPVLEALEEAALSVSVFELESNEREETTRWRVELLLPDKPKRKVIKNELTKLLGAQRLAPENIERSFLAHEDWLAKAAMPRETLEIGRFYIHGENDPAPSGA